MLCYVILKYIEVYLATFVAGDRLYVKPRLSTKFGERAFSFAGPHVWNQLPQQLRVFVVFSCIYLLYFVIQHFCCQSDNKIQFSSVHGVWWWRCLWYAVPSTRSLPVNGCPPPVRTKGRQQRRLYKPHKPAYGRPNHFVMMPPQRRNIPLGEHLQLSSLRLEKDSSQLSML